MGRLICILNVGHRHNPPRPSSLEPDDCVAILLSMGRRHVDSKDSGIPNIVQRLGYTLSSKIKCFVLKT